MSATQDAPALGFEDLHHEAEEPRELKVEGELPDWLTGSLLRNGPARWTAGNTRLNHWFDGQAMLHQFSFGQGRVMYANRFLDTQARRIAEREGTLATREFATDPCRSIFQRVHALFSPVSSLTDNANVSVQRLGDQLIAMTETPLAINFDPETLETLGLAYEAPGQLSTAHPHYDRSTGALINYAAQLGPRSRYRIFRMNPGDSTPEILAEVPVKQPAYMHSFAITERYFVLTEFPLVVNPAKLAISNQPFISNYRWRPERGTTFTVVARDDGRLVERLQGPACFAFHHINAFDQGDEVIIDLCAAEDASLIDDLYLDRIRRRLDWPANGDTGFSAPPHPTRCRLNLQSCQVEVSRLSEEILELPVVNHRRVRERSHRYLWGTGSDGNWLDRLLALDLADGSVTTWQEPGSYPGEPIFVERPGATDEADGVLLSVVLAGRSSSLLVLDAASMQVRARAAVGHPIPYGFHGMYSSRA